MSEAKQENGVTVETCDECGSTRWVLHESLEIECALCRKKLEAKWSRD